MAIFAKSSPKNGKQNIFFNKIKNVPSIGFPHKFSISAQKVTPQGLVDAPDPQESILGPEQCRLVRFSISLAQRIAYGRDPLLDYADLKNLNVCAFRTNLLCTVKLWPDQSIPLLISFSVETMDYFSILVCNC